jgi:SAM-dependent methyltransferase
MIPLAGSGMSRPTMPTPPLHEFNPIGRFSDRAADYVKYRPGYPPEAIDAILDGLAPPTALVAADIGAGTGISARLLASRGMRVVAIEPGDDMRGAADPHPRVTWVAARAEATGLSPASLDLIVCAHSFHWFKAGHALREFARILRPPGRLALMWNRRSKKDPLTAAFRQAILHAGGESPAERMEFDPQVIPDSRLFTPPERLVFANTQRLDAGGLVGRAQSASYVPKTGAAAAALSETLTDLHRRFADGDGFVTLVYDTEVFLARRL